MCKNKIQLIKDNVSIEDILNLYGLKLNFKNMCQCPIHKDTNPSFEVFKDNHFKCYGCGTYGDVIELFMRIEEVSKVEALKILCAKFKLNDNNHNYNQKDYKPKVLNKVRENIKPPHFKNPKVIEYVQRCRENINKTNYFKKRGLLDRTIKKFRLGYDPLKNAVVIPYNRSLDYYQLRYLNPNAKFKFWKVPTSEVGSEILFNQNAFNFSPIIFVVESPICAMSISQCGGVAVPLCGVVNVKLLLEYLKNNYYAGTIVVCLDNDVAGENAKTELLEGKPRYNLAGLNELKINYLVENIADECKDPNELLMKNWHRLRVNIERTILKIKK